MVAEIRSLAEAHGINFRYPNSETVMISFDETTTPSDIQDVINIFVKALDYSEVSFDFNVDIAYPESLTRTSEYLSHEVFHVNQSEHEILRYMIGS